MAKTCPTCGTLNPNEANVCFNCGTAIAPYASTAPDMNAPTVPQNPFQQSSYPAAPSYPQSYPNPPSPYTPPVAPPAPYQQAPYGYAQYPAQPMMMVPMPVYPAIAKSRVAYILFGVFLGMFGVHNFYAGYVGRGIAQLLLTLFTCGYAAVIVFIWSIIEIIVVDRDANGVPMN